MVVRHTADSFTAPTNGNAYSVGATIGSGVVVFNGSGTSVANDTGLSAGTTYYYKVYTVNGDYYSSGATTVSATTTSTPSLSAVTLSSGLTATYPAVSSGVSFTASGSALSANITATAQSGYEVSTSSGSGYGSSVSVASGTTVYVRLAAKRAAGNYNGATAVVLSSTGATNQNVTTSSSGNTVSQKALTISGASATNRAYDATTTVAVSGGSLVGVESGDTVTLGGSPTGSVASATVGNSKAVTVTGYSISGASSGNYSLSQPTGLTVNITKATPTISVAPTASGIKYAQALSASSFSGGTSSTAGTYSWQDSTVVPNPGTTSYTVNFTPTDSTNFNSTTTTVSVTSTMAQARNSAGAASPVQPSGLYVGDNGSFSADTWGTIDSAWGRGRLVVRQGNADLSGGTFGDYGSFVNSDNKSFTSARFNAAGTWYWGIQMDYGGTYGSNFWYKSSNSGWTDMSTSGVGSTLSVSVTALVNPTLTSVSADSSTAITLNWSRGVSGIVKDTIIVRREGSAVANDPVQGTGYNASDTISAGTVIYRGSATTFQDTGLNPGTTYHYKVYAENWSYYSSGVTGNATTHTTPAAPAIGTITPGNGQLSVAFTAGSDGGSAITGYKWAVNGGAYTLRSGTANPIVITGLSNGTAYTVSIRAVNAVGDGAVATASSSATPVTVPAAPTISSITEGDATLTVNFAAGATGGSAITNYEYSTDGGSNWTTPNPAITASPITITGLSNGTAYSVQIRALNVVGTGTATASTSATPRAAATAPGAPTISSITPGNGSLSVAFAGGSDGGAAITNYEYSTNDGSTWTTRSPASTASPISITGLSNGTSYNVKIRAVNSVGSGEASLATAGTPSTTPDAPTGLTVTPGVGQLSLSFTAPAVNGGSAITNYEYSTNGGSSFTAVSPASTSTSITIADLSNGTSYNVQVRAVNVAGSGAATASVAGTPRTTPTVTSGSASSIAAYSATLGGNITVTGGANATVRGVEYSTSNNFTTGTGTQATASGDFGTGAFTVNVTGLDSGTTYYFRAFATNPAGTVYGSQASFTTTTMPKGENPAVANVTTAYLGEQVELSIKTWQYLNSTARSWATVIGRWDNQNLTSSTVEGAGYNPGVGADQFGINTPRFGQTGTFYWAVRVSYGFGNDYWFDASRATWTDLGTSAPTIASQSIVVSALNSPTGLSTSDITSTSITLNWTKGNSNGEKDTIIVRRQGSAVSDQPVQGTAYNATDALGTGTVVYRGSASTFTDSGLSASTTYHYSIYSENWSYYSSAVSTSAQTAAPPPSISVAAGTLAFGRNLLTSTTAEQNYTLSGSNFTEDLTITAPTGYQVSKTSGSGYASSVTVTPTSGTIGSTTIYVRYAPTADGDQNGDIAHTSSGLTTANKAVTGAGRNLPQAQNPATANATTAYVGDIVQLRAQAWQTWNDLNLANQSRSYATVFGRFGNANLSNAGDLSEGAGRDPGSAAGDFYAESPRFTQAGTFYWAMRVSYGFGNDFWFDASRASLSAFSTSRPSTATMSVVVSELNNPSNLVATAASTSQINLTWTKGDSGGEKDTLVLRNTSNSFGTPTPGTAYNAGDTVGTATVVYRGSASSFNDTGLSAGTQYYYKVFSENWSYYSPSSSGTVTANARTVYSLSGEAITLTRDGDSFSASASGVSGFTYSYVGRTANGIATSYGPSATAPTAAGYYTVTATSSDSNYSGSTSSNYHVTGPIAAADSVSRPTGNSSFSIPQATLTQNDKRIHSDGSVQTGNLSVTSVTASGPTVGLSGVMVNFTTGGAGAETFTYTLTDSVTSKTTTATVTVTPENSVEKFEISGTPGSPSFDGDITSVTMTFTGTPNTTYTVYYKGELSDATWKSAGGVYSENGTFTVEISEDGNHVSDWTGSMFFRAVK